MTQQYYSQAIILDLSGTGNVFKSIDGAHVNFDWDGDGFATETGWIDGANAAFLFYDSNNNDKVDGAGELNFSLYSDSAETSLGGLAIFDSEANGGNGNGSLDFRDALYGAFKIWRDRNEDGITDDGEVISLYEFGNSNYPILLVN